MILDTKRECIVGNCHNIGQYHGRYVRVADGVCVITRRPLCVRHRREHRGVTARRSNKSQAKFRKNFCHQCAYCGWVGPCDAHRIIPATAGGTYVEENMKSACPNCHRLSSMGLVADKFLL